MRRTSGWWTVLGVVYLAAVLAAAAGAVGAGQGGHETRAVALAAAALLAFLPLWLLVIDRIGRLGA